MSTNTLFQTEKYTIPSIVATVAAVLSFTTGAVLGLLFATVAIIAGLAGIVMALSPAKRGGLLSILAIFGGLIGVVAAVVKAVMWLF